MVPPDTDPTAAHAAVMTAADPDDASTAEELLAIGMRAAQDGRPASMTDHRGESDGET